MRQSETGMICAALVVSCPPCVPAQPGRTPGLLGQPALFQVRIRYGPGSAMSPYTIACTTNLPRRGVKRLARALLPSRWRALERRMHRFQEPSGPAAVCPAAIIRR